MSPPSMVGWALGLLDATVGALGFMKRQVAPRYRHFDRDGWGDLAVDLDHAFKQMKAFYQEHAKGPEHYATSVVLDSNAGDLGEASDAPRILTATFPSPMQACLPEESKRVPFRIVLPQSEPWAVVVICGGTTDETFIYRQKAFAEPLRNHGVASLLPMPPFYGTRRRKGQYMYYMSSLSDMVLQCYAESVEAIALLDWARVRYPKALLGMVGISKGAGVVIGSSGHVHRDVAVVPILMPSSPSVLATGSYVHELSLEALGASLRGEGPTWTDVRQLLVDTLDSVGSPDCAGALPLLPRGSYQRCAVCVGAASDGIVSRESTLKAFERLRETQDEHAELQWISGGHSSSIIRAPAGTYVKPVLRSLRRLSEAQKPCSRL